MSKRVIALVQQAVDRENERQQCVYEHYEHMVQARWGALFFVLLMAVWAWMWWGNG